MKYEYRQVKCPWCNHVFMWTKDGGEGLILHSYRIKETEENVEEAICPKCEEKMLVLPHILEGIDTDDKRIEVIRVRGL